MQEEYDFVLETLDHKRQVAFLLQNAANELVYRAIKHDDSKFSSEERPLFEKVTPILKTLEYGSEEYKQSVRDLGPALRHHYMVNDHHPEFNKDGIAEMDLIQLLEMLCDWIAAGKRTKDGDIGKSLLINKERFKIGDSLFLALVNTVEHGLLLDE